MSPFRPAWNADTINVPWYYTYVLHSKTKGNFYTGTTKNLNQRLKQHNNGLVFSTKSIRSLHLIYFEACPNKDDTYRRERYSKLGMGKRYLRNCLKGGLKG